MSTNDITNVYYGPGADQYKAVSFSGGGGIVHYCTPTFASIGGSLEVHALDETGHLLGVKTFALLATAQGAAYLGEALNQVVPIAAGGFLPWVEQFQGQAKGYLGFARTAPVTLGRGGVGPPVSSNGVPTGWQVPNGVQVIAATILNNQPETLNIGECLAWCCVADSHGWDIRGGGGSEVVVTGSLGSDGSGSITAGGTAQNLFAGAIPANGWKVANPDALEDLWVSESVAAAPNGQGSWLIKAGMIYETPVGEKPFHAISLYGATTGHKYTASQW